MGFLDRLRQKADARLIQQSEALAISTYQEWTEAEITLRQPTTVGPYTFGTGFIGPYDAVKIHQEALRTAEQVVARRTRSYGTWFLLDQRRIQGAAFKCLRERTGWPFTVLSEVGFRIQEAADADRKADDWTERRRASEIRRVLEECDTRASRGRAQDVIKELEVAYYKRFPDLRPSSRATKP